MGQHVWLLLATIGTEVLAITKWSAGQFPEPLPTTVKWAWTLGGTLLVLYPVVQVCLDDPAYVLKRSDPLVDSLDFRARGRILDANSAN